MKFNLINIYDGTVFNTVTMDPATIQVLNYAYALNASPLRWKTQKETTNIQNNL